jgi:ubiquinone/menaquinone biosynthesis C-methylase UbiE
LYAAAGAIVTVVDISPAMLELDRDVARERGLTLRTVEASIDELSMLASGEFDLVVHPVSTCYVPEIVPVFRSVARVTAPHGIYVSQHKTPVSLQASQRPGAGRCYEITEPYYKREPLPPVLGSRLREEGTLEYVHRWEEILGGLCRSGFTIEDALEPQHADLHAAPGEFGHRALFIAPYIRLKARRMGTQASGLILSDA